MRLHHANNSSLNTPRPRRLHGLVVTSAVTAALVAAPLGVGASAPAVAQTPTLSAASLQLTAPVASTASGATKASRKLTAKKARIAAGKRYRAKIKRIAKKKPRTAAKKMMKARGYSKRQRTCVIKLWNKESNWRWWADNPSSSAYGIPQALPGSKMRSAGADWRTNPVTQIKWGLRYIKDRHGSPCGAWNHSKRVGWY